MRVELSCSVAKVVACALVILCGIPGRIEAHNLSIVWKEALDRISAIIWSSIRSVAPRV
jgi:hypothetical protein